MYCRGQRGIIIVTAWAPSGGTVQAGMSLAAAVDVVQPTALLGLSACHGLFTPDIIRAMVGVWLGLWVPVSILV